MQVIKLLSHNQKPLALSISFFIVAIQELCGLPRKWQTDFQVLYYIVTEIYITFFVQAREF